jgi:hypothetical protein
LSANAVLAERKYFLAARHVFASQEPPEVFSGKEKAVSGKLCVLALATMFGVFGVAGCSTTDSAAEQAYANATDACERMQSTDQREQCFDAAMRNYQAGVQKRSKAMSACPGGTC